MPLITIGLLSACIVTASSTSLLKLNGSSSQILSPLLLQMWSLSHGLFKDLCPMCYFFALCHLHSFESTSAFLLSSKNSEIRLCLQVIQWEFPWSSSLVLRNVSTKTFPQMMMWRLFLLNIILKLWSNYANHIILKVSGLQQWRDALQSPRCRNVVFKLHLGPILWVHLYWICIFA